MYYIMYIFGRHECNYQHRDLFRQATLAQAPYGMHTALYNAYMQCCVSATRVGYLRDLHVRTH